VTPAPNSGNRAAGAVAGRSPLAVRTGRRSEASGHSPAQRRKLTRDVEALLERYLLRLEQRGVTLEDVGGMEAILGAVEAALPAANSLAERAGKVYTTRQLQTLLPGVHAEPLKDQAVYNRVRSRTLIGAKTADHRWVFPAFQFQARPGRLQPRQDVIDLWQLLPPADDRRVDAWTLISWLGGPRQDLAGLTPLQWLDQHGIDERLQRAAGQVRRRASV
jgi:hypothetical protein